MPAAPPQSRFIPGMAVLPCKDQSTPRKIRRIFLKISIFIVNHRYHDFGTDTDTQNSYRYRYQIPIFSSGIGMNIGIGGTLINLFSNSDNFFPIPRIHILHRRRSVHRVINGSDGQTRFLCPTREGTNSHVAANFSHPILR